MPTNCLTSFDGLRRRMGGTSIHPSAHAIEAKRLIKYLQNLGFAITTADDVRGAIEADRSEAELSAHRCVEGEHAYRHWPDQRVRSYVDSGTCLGAVVRSDGE